MRCFADWNHTKGKNERSESGVTVGSKMSLLVQNDSIFVTIGSKRFSFVLFATRNGPFVCFELTAVEGCHNGVLSWPPVSQSGQVFIFIFWDSTVLVLVLAMTLGAVTGVPMHR